MPRRQPLPQHPSPAAASPYLLSLREDFRSGRLRSLGRFSVGPREAHVLAGGDSLWVVVRGGAPGGVALRAAYCAGGYKVRRLKPRRDEAMRLALTSAMGRHTVRLRSAQDDLPLVRITVELTPAADLLVPFLPRDLYPLGSGDDPLAAVGVVEAAQRGLNAGLCYLSLDTPAAGSLLYFQNFTPLNPYFRATRAKPDGAVGGRWPELGYLPPTGSTGGATAGGALPARVPVTIADTLVILHEDVRTDEAHAARLFLQMLGTAYRQIERPTPKIRDWPARAEQTLHDLEAAGEATVRHYGATYVRPYLDAEYPDSMVQMSLISALHDHAAWTGVAPTLERALSRGMPKFFDAELGTVRRYLPNVGRDKDADAVDSWYLYHPLLNLGRMALDGDGQARRLFEGSLNFAIRAARHFRYAWPVQFKVTDFSVIVGARNDDGLGQTDVGGLYAYVMLQAHELTREARFIDEARAAIDAAKGMRFELNYQANLTAWGAAACLRLWRITNDQSYLQQSYVYLASFFHNTVLWSSDLKVAAQYETFLAVSSLHNGPYMALYECFESFAAFERYLKDSGPDLDPAVRLLVSQYCRYAPGRAWSYFPAELTAESICEKPRNGWIARERAFPLEDLYVGGDQAGQVGQEVYGAGAAFVFASRTFHNVAHAPFRVFCDHFLMASQRTSARSLTFQLGGAPDMSAALVLERIGRERFRSIRVVDAGRDKTLRPVAKTAARVDYCIPAAAQVRLEW